MSNSNKSNDRVVFYPEQIQYLRRVFPIVVFGHSSTVEEMRYYNGQQSVLQFIEGKQ